LGEANRPAGSIPLDYHPEQHPFVHVPSVVDDKLSLDPLYHLVDVSLLSRCNNIVDVLEKESASAVLPSDVEAAVGLAGLELDRVE
jgi:hypothetical protein